MSTRRVILSRMDPRDNGFPNDCCKPPDFESWPFPGPVGGGDGNPCLCQSGLHPTPEGKVFGPTIVDGTVTLDSTSYILVPIPGTSENHEEWVAIPS